MKFLKNNAVKVINGALFALIIFNLSTIDIAKEKASIAHPTKQLNSMVMTYTSKEALALESEEKIEESSSPVIDNEEVEVKQEETPLAVEPEEQILETFVGKVSGYGPDCVGCSGITSSGYNIYHEGIYYQDITYGQVRIVAGDPKYPFGTIVRMKNTVFSTEPILTIVLDRGSAIGIGRVFDFDLLYESEQQTNGISKEVTFEVLRLGF